MGESHIPVVFFDPLMSGVSLQKEAESTTQSITSILSADDAAEVLDKVRSATQRECMVLDLTNGGIICEVR